MYIHTYIRAYLTNHGHIHYRADVNDNGSLDEQEFYQFVEQVKLKYPQLMTYLSMACDYSIEKLAHMHIHMYCTNVIM